MPRGNLQVTVGKSNRRFKQSVGRKQILHNTQKGIGDNSDPIGRTLGRPIVISESADRFGTTQSMRPMYSEDISRKIKTCKGPAIKDRGTFTALGATVGGLVPG